MSNPRTGNQTYSDFGRPINPSFAGEVTAAALELAKSSEILFQPQFQAGIFYILRRDIIANTAPGKPLEGTNDYDAAIAQLVRKRKIEPEVASTALNHLDINVLSFRLSRTSRHSKPKLIVALTGPRSELDKSILGLEKAQLQRALGFVAHDPSARKEPVHKVTIANGTTTTGSREEFDMITDALTERFAGPIENGLMPVGKIQTLQTGTARYQ